MLHIVRDDPERRLADVRTALRTAHLEVSRLRRGLAKRRICPLCFLDNSECRGRCGL